MDMGWSCRGQRSVCSLMRFTTTLKMGQSSLKRYSPCIKLLDLISGQLHLPAALSPRRNSPGPTQYGLDALYKRKPLALPASSHRRLRWPALILVSTLITQPFSGIEAYAVFLGPYTKRWAMLHHEVHGHFLYNFRKYTRFSNKADNFTL